MACARRSSRQVSPHQAQKHRAGHGEESAGDDDGVEFRRELFRIDGGDASNIRLAGLLRLATPLPHGSIAALPLGVASLAAFLRNPVQAFFRHRLRVAFDEPVQLPAGARFIVTPRGAPAVTPGVASAVRCAA